MTDNAASLSLADGENNNNVDFGYTGSGSIGDTIYFDADNSGSETAGDTGIPGVTITLAGDLNNDRIEDILDNNRCERSLSLRKSARWRLYDYR